MPLRATLALICAATPTIALAQLPPAKAIRELSTDRPDKTESPFTVAAGRIQVELDVASFVRDEEQGAVSETFTIAPVSLKFGIARNTDLQLIFGGHILRTERIAATPVPLRTQGVGDVTVRLKHNLWGNDGGPTALAFLPFLTLPTGSNGLGVEAVEFGLIVPLAMSVAPGVGVGLMTEIDFVRSDTGRGYQPSFINSATVAFDLTNRLGLYTELFTERGTARGSRWIATGDIGLTYAVGANAQLDAGLNLGLTQAADDVGVFIGVSRRF